MTEYGVYVHQGNRPRKIFSVKGGAQEALDIAADLNRGAPNAYFAGLRETDGTVLRIKSVETLAVNDIQTLDELKASLGD